MNILLIHNYYKIRGGEDAVFENESEFLQKLGHNIFKYSRNNTETENLNFVKKIKFFISAIYNKQTIIDLKNILSRNKIDIVHIHNTFPIISPSIYRFLKKENIKVVQTIHNYRFLCSNGLFYRDEQICTLCKSGNNFHAVKYKCYKESYLYSFLYFLILQFNKNIFKKNINGYIVLTDFVKNVFIESGFPIKKIFVKDNGFEDSNYFRQKSSGYFLYFGRISKEKGIDFLLESFSKIPDYQLLIAGTGENLEFYKNKYKGSTNIKFLGFLSGEEKNKIISQSEALIVPSVWYENYPVTIIESFRLGIPVIGTNIGGIPYIVSDKINGLLFEKENFIDFKNKLDKISTNKNLREKFGDNARNTFLDRMEFSQNIKRLENIYKEVLNA